MHIKIFTALISLFLITSAAKAQEAESQVLVIKDSLIDILQEYRASNSVYLKKSNSRISLEEKKIDKSRARRVKTKGFRVQVYSGSSRSEAANIQNDFLRKHPKTGAYMSYEEPNYRVKVGDFRNRSQATEFMNRIRREYKNVFIFIEDIWVWQ